MDIPQAIHMELNRHVLFQLTTINNVPIGYVAWSMEEWVVLSSLTNTRQCVHVSEIIYVVLQSYS